ncbi:Antirestriction protein [Patulibacter medicamentivorans]|uniref:Antirestriction protein n=1 Tax=Patulibacter medicamentivorans TaxID=1097667 RepID=H0E9B4_9ACTN|nr:zincin-like metallopeptidase domain-containing protein [Patulibacter medicamentivorans]EHN09724.1 Antirestriction protein [Patulibacter medicamentivorans]
MPTQATAPKATSSTETTRKRKRDRVDAYKMAADAVLEAMDRGTIPWRMPWTQGPGAIPRNLASGRPYRGINVFLLAMAGYASPFWLTFKQAKTLGGQVRKGEKSTPAILWKQTKKRLKTPADVAAAKANGDTIRKDERGQYVLLILARTFALFNVAQVDGLTNVPEVEQIGEGEWSPAETAEAIAAGYEDGPSMGEGGDSASYNPARDHVQMPDRGRFTEATDWHATLFHELAHSTGHADRLNRPDLVDPSATFGSKKYAREELTAEMAAAMLCTVAGIDAAPLTERHAAYVEHWAERIGEDPKLVVIAAQRAQKACDLILGPDQDQDAETTAAPAAEVAA